MTDTEAKEIRRLAAMMTACKGISTTALEGGAIKELAEAAKSVSSGMVNHCVGCSTYDAKFSPCDCAMNDLRAALAKLEAPDA